jgi:hypothetical protein
MAIPRPGELVAFVIGGAQKGGTTALDGMLRAHPAVSMASIKEPKWFDDDRRFTEPAAVDDYHALFAPPSPDRLRGEATPTYVWWPPAAQRIRQYNPAMRWILLLRDPAARAYSQWNMRRTRETDLQAFTAAIDDELARGAQIPVRNVAGTNYLSRGFYAAQLERLLALFPREQLLLLRSERFRSDPAATLGEVHAFLGIDARPVDAPAEAWVGEYPEALPPAIRAKLVAIFASDVRRLERLTGWDLADWLS